MKPVLFAIFCWKSWKTMVLQCFCNQSAQKPYKTCAFCNILLNMLKKHWFYYVFAIKVHKNTIKPVFFAICCWKSWKTIVLQCFCNQSAQKPYKTCAFCNILLEKLKNHWFYCVVATRVLKNRIKPVRFAIFCWKCWKTTGFPLFFELRLQKDGREAPARAS